MTADPVAAGVAAPQRVAAAAASDDLPRGWVWTRLGGLVSLVRGVSYDKSAASDSPGDGRVPILRATNIQSEHLLLDEELVYVPERYVGSEQMLKERDIVICTSSGSRNLVGKAAQLTRVWQGSFGAFCAVARVDPQLEARFVGLYFSSPHYREFIREKSVGVNINNLKAGDIEGLSVLVPPLGEQRRIVAAIEQQFTRLNAGVAALRRAQTALKRYRAAVLKAAVEGRLTDGWRRDHPDAEPATTLLARILAERRARWEADLRAKGKDPARTRHPEPAAPDTARLSSLPDGWCWATFEQISDRVTVGHVGPMKDEYIEDGVPFLRSQNVRPNRFDPDGLKFVSREFHRQLAKSALEPGDLLVVRSGSVGVACVMPDTYPEANCSDLVIVKRPILVSPEYAAYYMNSAAQSRVKLQQVGIALTHFNTHSMASLPVPLPPLAEQQAIVAEVERRLSVVAELEAAVAANLARAERLRQAILREAFAGRLVPQDPDDEPASALLERIRAEREDANPGDRREHSKRHLPAAVPVTLWVDAEHNR